MENSLKITALAITLNEGKIIESFVKSLWFVDEIIIIDSFSTDDTVTLASKDEKVTTYQRSFNNFSDQKNFAISKAKNDWIVFFDPDEEITKPLADEIISTLKNPLSVAYFVKRELYFMGKHIKYSGFQSDWIIRVFNKNNCKYDGNLVHEMLKTEGETSKIKNKLPHHTYKSLDNYTAKLHRYSALQAQMLYDKKKKPSLAAFLFRPFYRFWHQYLIRLGILDGKEGFILAYINAFAVFKRHTNLWMLYRKIE